MRNGDWVLRLDADEIYHVHPPIFVRERMRPLETAVMGQWYHFRITWDEVKAYESGQVDVAADRKRPITDRRRYYRLPIYAEPRMFRYRRGMQWPETTSAPFNAGYVARERLPIRHYSHRDPLQMIQRFRLRSTMMKIYVGTGDHWKVEDWRKGIIDAQAKTAVAENVLHYWQPGTPLPEVPLHNHLPGMIKRMAQRMVHPLLLPLLDSCRPRFNPAHTPRSISEDVNEQIGHYVKTGEWNGDLNLNNLDKVGEECIRN
ncbi:MAG: hypothetical protein FWD61_13270 [Phycisphaerales bacterium]|nr:hypothetical protein [Phycisphaerales bacterium]